MLALLLLVGVLAVSMGFFLGTQVVIPFFKGTRFFPLFRKKNPLDELVVQLSEEVALETEIVDANTKLVELKRRKAELEKKL